MSSLSQAASEAGHKRIVSLSPAATEWLVEIGGGGTLVGRSHLCDDPESLPNIPAVTHPRSSAEETLSSGFRSQWLGVDDLAIDIHALAALRPDLVVLAGFRGPHFDPGAALGRLLRSHLGHSPDTFVLTGRTFKSVLDDALQVGRLAGQLSGTMAYIAARERGLRQVQNRIVREITQTDRRALEGGRPSVVCIERLEPLMAWGDWMPDLVWLAQGRDAVGSAGAASSPIDPDHLLEIDPDVLLVIPRGGTAEEARRRLRSIANTEDWSRLTAVRSGRLFLLDAKRNFSRPGPRLYRAVELLSAALHGVRLETRPQPSEIRRVKMSPTA